MTTTTTTTAGRKTPLEDVPGAEQVTEQIREYSDQVVASAKTFGNYALDAYEQAANAVLEVQSKAAASIKADWLPSFVPAVINAGVTFSEDVNRAYVKAARTALA
jgi:hypothetical protein